MNKQVDKKHYEFRKYSRPERWVSYFHQINQVLSLEPESVLEIGVGDKVFGSYIKQNTDIQYKNLDIAEDLDPDIMGSVLNIPLQDNSFDLVCAFEVLEHLPFHDFERALREMHRVARKNVVISLPHFGPPVQFFLKVPFFRALKFAFKVPYKAKHVFNGEHYWEIGKREYSTLRIRKVLSKYFTIVDEFIPFENQYHHFFMLCKK